MKKISTDGFLRWVLPTVLFIGTPCLLGAQPAVDFSNMDKGLRAEKAGDYPQALKWYRMVADEGASAECNIGTMYAQGYGVTQNYQEAMRWFLMPQDKGTRRPSAISE